MIGHEPIIAARLRREPLERIDLILTDKRPSYEVGRASCYDGVGDCWILPDDAIDGLDLRFCQGVRVNVHADDYNRGMRVFSRVCDFRPSTTVLIHPTAVVRFNPTTETIEEWAL